METHGRAKSCQPHTADSVPIMVCKFLKDAPSLKCLSSCPLFHLLYQHFRLLQKKGELTSCVSDQVTAAGIHSKQSAHFKQIFLQELLKSVPWGED